MNFLGLDLYLSVSLGWTGKVSVWSAMLATADTQTANATSSVSLLQSLLQATVLGLVQGVTELLPIDISRNYVRANGREPLPRVSANA